eukprot:GHVR01193353.1.p1 GENE.GHVR01193353.1~~GHVR01193353.1.p1  ORF type:complete len:313 (+),score=31.88 GHVR01193353.1:88-1026(+)
MWANWLRLVLARTRGARQPALRARAVNRRAQQESISEMNHYQGKQEAKRLRLEAAADKAETRAEDHRKASDRITEHIPLGQPILVGHHSERSHRNALERSHKHMFNMCAERGNAAELRRRAKRVGSGGVSADDPEAVTKLRAKLLNLEKARDSAKRLNTLWRKAGKPGHNDNESWTQLAREMTPFGMKPTTVAKIQNSMANDPCNRGPFPPYVFTNWSSEIRRVKKRIDTLLAEDDKLERTLTGTGFEIRDDKKENRIYIDLDTKPPKEICTFLRREGWRWTPSLGYWGRQLNNSGRWHAKTAHDYLTEKLS